MNRPVYVSFLCLLLCASVQSATTNNWNSGRELIRQLVMGQYTPVSTRFYVCKQHGCKQHQQVSFEPDLWRRILGQQPSQVASSPATERAWIAGYIARAELWVGRLTNTQYDQGGTFPALVRMLGSQSDQMDCIDESANTLTYLKLLQSEGLFQWHTLIGLVTRGGLFAGYPHTAVLIQEKQSGQEYVVDSWFLANARPAHILPYTVWKKGWTPND